MLLFIPKGEIEFKEFAIAMTKAHGCDYSELMSENNSDHWIFMLKFLSLMAQRPKTLQDMKGRDGVTARFSSLIRRV